MEVCPYSFLQWYGYFWVLWVSLVTRDEFSVRATKITSRIGVSWIRSLPFNSVKWPYCQKGVNQMNLNHTSCWNLALPKFEVFIPISLNVNPSLNKTLLTLLLCVNNSGNFSVSGYVPLIRNDSVTHMHGLAVYVKVDFVLHRTYL